MTATRIYLAISALFGLAGVAMLASGAHATGGSMTIAGQMLLFHAPVLMAGALARKLEFLHGRIGQIALALIVLGVSVFAGDLAIRASQGVKLFAMAAPMGGILTMAGWAGLVLASFMGRQR
jgi:uncharacterized membrane protein YgdD (TMEM256/DUF423 family)